MNPGDSLTSVNSDGCSFSINRIPAYSALFAPVQRVQLVHIVGVELKIVHLRVRVYA